MPRSLMMSIAAVERDTGLSKDTLRIWEKRYGFPSPVRDAQGERCYPMEQVERLRLIKRLLDVGHRPGRVVGLPPEDLQTLADRSADAQGQPTRTGRQRQAGAPAAPTPATPSPRPSYTDPSAPGDWVDDALARVDAHDVAGFKRLLAQAVPTLGLARFISEVCAPLLKAMGEGWLRGRFQVPQEHWVSQCLQQSLHAAIHALPPTDPSQAPRVLLSTFPGEPHALGLLMVEGWLALQGAQVINLGAQTPTADLIDACENHRADVVALSFSASAPAHLVQDALPAFRDRLPPRVAIWAGGRNPLLARRAPAGVLVLDDLPDLQRAIQAWHLGQSSQGAQASPP
ncbi:MerR family transcriptional regulator [Aquabacterium parvum]|uniref:MerR family transcriptional regulator n=1 Tax=Aquabacterium parvum TaxID=70584 RepID=UPI0009FAD1CD|nr:MerR family transcriptional regulator [Aquabacterium parvum]MBU0916427.1 MerR family transcriptional regulator [Gammaproteobacteria bacterium]